MNEEQLGRHATVSGELCRLLNSLRATRGQVKQNRVWEILEKAQWE